MLTCLTIGGTDKFYHNVLHLAIRIIDKIFNHYPQISLDSKEFAKAIMDKGSTKPFKYSDTITADHTIISLSHLDIFDLIKSLDKNKIKNSALYEKYKQHMISCIKDCITEEQNNLRQDGWEINLR